MKKSIVVLILLLAQSLMAQVYLGLRDSRYAGIGYVFSSKYDLKIEQSIYPEDLEYQYFRLNANAIFSSANLMLSYKLYYGLLYNRDYYDVGGNFRIAYDFMKRLNTYADLNPHYDSGYSYKMNYGFGLKVRVYKGAGLVAGYSTIPEYRQSEKRIRAGLIFEENTLSVSPMISLPAEKELTTMRVLVSINYVL